jgi:HAD superfamily hydrolase (TIGR01662 family)
MRQPFIRAILFDLGGTLMYPRAPWPPVLAQANQALSDALCGQIPGLDCADIAREFNSRLTEYYTQRDQDLFETTYMSVLRELLDHIGYQNVPDKVLRSALDAMYAVTQSNWLLEEDALPTLKALEASGYRMGIVSNAGDNQDVFQLVNRFGIEIYFDFILTSAACSYRKPHTRIFEVALAHWKMPTHEAAMIGDTLEADILGANRAGLYSIWISRRAQTEPGQDRADIQPAATIHSLSELPSLLENSTPR